jgi:hypothetical protein
LKNRSILILHRASARRAIQSEIRPARVCSSAGMIDLKIGLITRREKGGQEQEGNGAETKGTSKKAEKEGWDGRGEAGDGCRINDIEELVANLRCRLRAAPSNFVTRCLS